MMKYKELTIKNKETGENYYYSSKEIILRDWLQYPNNSIEHKRIFEKLLNNIDKIPIDKLEELIDS